MSRGTVKTEEGKTWKTWKMWKGDKWKTYKGNEDGIRL